MEKYNGYNVNLMSELIQVSKDYKKVINFLDRYIEKFNIKETCVHELVDGCKYKKLAKRFKLKGKEEYIYGLKVILDFETELSNFLVHIGQLNEVFYKYCSMRECGQYSNSELKEYQIQFEEKLLELKEDENARLAFELGFLYLKIINFVLRTEDDDYTKLDYSKVDVTMFEYKSEEMLKYASSNRIEENKIQHYVIERMRNALMHGHISIDITENGEPVFSFTDIYNKREELIEISFDNLKLFLEQDSLYSGISTKTDLLFGISLN